MMDANQLIGQQVHVRAADLFGVPAPAVVRAIGPDSISLLLEFVPPIQIDTKTYPFAVVHPRLQRDNLGVFLTDGVLGCAVTCVPRDRYDSAKPFDMTWWRGGGATVADLLLSCRN